MREPYSRDLKMLLDQELEKNERVRATLTAYQELAEEEKALFRLAAGISEDTAAVAREPGQRSRSQENEGNQPDRLQPLGRDLMKTATGGPYLPPHGNGLGQPDEPGPHPEYSGPATRRIPASQRKGTGKRGVGAATGGAGSTPSCTLADSMFAPSGGETTTWTTPGASSSS